MGGTGADLLFGNFDEDILVAGTTAFDNDALALGLVMANLEERIDRLVEV